jgi:hypothetical protein
MDHVFGAWVIASNLGSARRQVLGIETWVWFNNTSAVAESSRAAILSMVNCGIQSEYFCRSVEPCGSEAEKVCGK